MYINYLPAELPENWLIAEIDEENNYLEFQGFEGEFLISIMKDSYGNPDEPFHLALSPLKGILSRYDLENLEWQDWFTQQHEAVKSALDLMKWMNENYSNFDPVTLEVYVSLGEKNQLPVIEKYYKDKLIIHELEGERLVFKKVNLGRGSWSYSQSAIDSLCHFAKSSSMNPRDLKCGILTNEKFQMLEDLRPELIAHYNSMISC